MPHNSTAVIGESNSSKTQLILNTTHLSGQDLNDYISLCEEIERLKLSQRQRPSFANSIKAKMTREEIFECSDINDDEFLTALEHQNSYDASPATQRELNLSQSIEDMMKYFDEDISLSSKSNRSTPTNLATIGKVAAVVASFTKKCETVTSPPPPPLQKNVCNVKELKAKYEASTTKSATSEKTITREKQLQKQIQTPPLLKAPALIAAVTLTSAAQLANKSNASPKSSRKSKVKQIAQIFNTKISQLVNRNLTDIGLNYIPLNNEYSPDSKSATTKSNNISSPVTPPIPKPRKKLLEKQARVPSFRTPTYCIRSPRVSPRLRRRPSKRENNSKSMYAEDAFSQLSVRDKVLLHTKFIEDMSQKNPKFSKHAEVLKSKVYKQLARGEVVNEKQESVKHLKEELEAKCTFPKQTISPKALMRMQSSNDTTFVTKLAEDSELQNGDGIFRAEYAQIDIEEEDSNKIYEDPLHVSSLTVVLKPSPKGKQLSSVISPSAGRHKPLTRSRRNERLLHHLSLFEPTQKRNNESIRSSHLSNEIYAPPKKIRRTRSERLNPQHFFQNADLEQLFFSWIKERNGIDFDIAHSDNEQKTIKIVQTEQEERSISSAGDITQKSNVERLLEEAIAKLENTILKHNDDIKLEAENVCESLPETKSPKEVKKKPKRKQKRPAPPVPVQQPDCTSTASSSAKPSDIECCETRPSTAPLPAPRNLKITSNSAISSAKQSDIDSESGVSTLQKLQSDESQPEQERNIPQSTTTSEFEFVKPQKPPRKRKTRRSLKNEAAIIESNLAELIAITTTTDSDSDCKTKVNEKSQSSPSPKSKQRGSHIKKLCFRTLKAITTPKQTKTAKIKQEQTPSKLNRKFLRAMNSPRRIKSAYTLTVLSSPSPHTESDQGEYRPIRETSRSWQSVLTLTDPNINHNQAEHAASMDLSHQTKSHERYLLSDSYADQGFETGSNSLDSPVRRSRHCMTTQQSSIPLFFSLSGDMERSSLSSRRSSYGLRALYNPNIIENPSNYSTPVKGHIQKSFISPAVTQQQSFSPIQTPLKPPLIARRRSSLYNAEARRSSIAMQVIRENQPYDPKESPPFTPDSLNADETAFFANAPTLDMPSNFDFNFEKPYSTFWIIVGDYTVGIKIFYNSTDRLRLLYDIFSQKNVDFRKLHFGIDDHKFTPYDPKDNVQSISMRLPPAKDSSHYWFSTGDLAVPFNGNFMPGKKVRRLFNFIYSCFDVETTVLRFGVDNFEFTHPRERLSNNTKLSMESNYSMLVGLQSGNSNGLEGRSKFAWPNPMCGILNANNAKTSDLDASDLDSSSFGSADLKRPSYSSFSNSPMSSSLNSTPRNSNDTASPDLYPNHIYENDILAQIYKDAEQYDLSKSQTDKMPRQKSMNIPELLEILQNQQQKLKSIEELISSYSNRISLSNDAFEQLKESPEYIRKLRNIIKVIDNIGRDNGFKACSLQQLESFMCFLSRYADICLTKCSDHMNQILNTLMEQRQVEN